MKQPLFRRIIALLLALSFVIGGAVLTVAADNGGGSVSDTTLDDVRELAKMNMYGAIIGKAYYTGAINISDAVKVAEEYDN